VNVAAILASLFRTHGGEFHRATVVGSHMVEIDISPPPPKPPIKYDGSWSQVKPRTPEEKVILQLSQVERHRLKQERKILLAIEQKEKGKS